MHVNLWKNKIKKDWQVHRLVGLTFILNSENKEQIDHIDNNPLNNNLTNLRWATCQENQRNTSIPLNNTSGVKGVVWDKSRLQWRAQISNNKIMINLGRYNTIEEATLVRQTRANELFGSFTNSCEKH